MTIGGGTAASASEPPRIERPRGGTKVGKYSLDDDVSSGTEALLPSSAASGVI
jgi:hypothetical protein